MPVGGHGQVGRIGDRGRTAERVAFPQIGRGVIALQSQHQEAFRQFFVGILQHQRHLEPILDAIGETPVEDAPAQIDGVDAGQQKHLGDGLPSEELKTLLEILDLFPQTLVKTPQGKQMRLQPQDFPRDAILRRPAIDQQVSVGVDDGEIPEVGEPGRQFRADVEAASPGFMAPRTHQSLTIFVGCAGQDDLAF